MSWTTRKFPTRAEMRANLLEVDDLPPVAWENQHFEPTTTNGKVDPYIAETLQPADEFQSANAERTGIGVYRLEVVVAAGSSISWAENLADAIKEQFKPGTLAGIVKIERSAVQQGIPEPPVYRVPIQIDYRTHEMDF